MENVNEAYNRRLEEKLDAISTDVKQLSREVLVLATINDSQKQAAETNGKKLDLIRLYVVL